MIELDVNHLFGGNYSQTDEEIIINKQSLRGLDINVNNPQSLLAAIIHTANDVFVGNLELPDGEALTTENDEPISYDNSRLYFVSINKWRIQSINGKARTDFLFSELKVNED